MKDIRVEKREGQGNLFYAQTPTALHRCQPHLVEVDHVTLARLEVRGRHVYRAGVDVIDWLGKRGLRIDEHGQFWGRRRVQLADGHSNVVAGVSRIV